MANIYHSKPYLKNNMALNNEYGVNTKEDSR